MVLYHGRCLLSTTQTLQGISIFLAPSLPREGPRNFCSPLNTDRIGGILRYAREHGWHIVLSGVGDQRFLGWDADGVLATIRANRSGTDICQSFQATKTPIVDLTDERPDLRLPRVTCDHEAIGRLAFEHLSERGFRDFAWFSTDWTNVHALRYSGFSASADVRKWAMSEMSRKSAGKSVWQNFLATLHPLLADAPKPLGILAYDEADASRILSACSEFGLSVPDQVAVIACGNEPLLCDFQPVTITGIDTNLDRQGYEAARLLDELMQSRKRKAERISIPPKGLTQRGSTDIYTATDPIVQAALKFIAQNLAKPLGAPEVAAGLGLPRHRLDRLFAATLKTSVGREIARLRLAQAHRLVCDTNLSISEIAQASGYCNAGYLINLFRKAYGTSPVAYRTQNRGDRPCAGL